MDLGVTIALAGLALLAATALGLVASFGFASFGFASFGFAVAVDRWFVRAEETALVERFGAGYADYQKRVSRWI